MQSNRYGGLALLVCLVVAGAAKTAHADDACIDFKWDVSKERALFAGTPTALAAGKDSASAPNIVPNRLYRLSLVPQEHVTFAVSPAGKAAAGALAGLATLKITAPGAYRVAIDLPVWIDVVSNGNLVAARDFEGQRNCSAPHKIVEFDLAGAQTFALQFSSGVSDNILVTVTPTPARKL